MHPRFTVFILGAVLTSSILSCTFAGRSPAAPHRDAADPPRVDRTSATPSSQLPSAGICAESAGGVAQATLHPDIPDPRCLRVTAAQSLEILNATDGPIQLVIADLEVQIMAGSESRFNSSFGDYLLPGAHLLVIDPCCGPEIWLVVGDP